MKEKNEYRICTSFNWTSNCVKTKIYLKQGSVLNLLFMKTVELEKYVAPVPKKSMTMKERIDKAKTKLSEKKPQETELKNDKLSNNKIKGENE